MSNTEYPDGEMRREQEFIDGLYARVDALRGDTEHSVTDALAQGNTPMQARLERDILVAERSGLLAALNAVDGSLCFGRIDFTSGTRHHIGRIGLRTDDAERTPVLIDWRADVARPFYLATGHTPMGLRRRRHLTTEGRRVTALHDEILDLGDRERTGQQHGPCAQQTCESKTHFHPTLIASAQENPRDVTLKLPANFRSLAPFFETETFFVTVRLWLCRFFGKGRISGIVRDFPAKSRGPDLAAAWRRPAPTKFFSTSE